MSKLSKKIRHYIESGLETPAQIASRIQTDWGTIVSPSTIEHRMNRMQVKGNHNA